MWKLKVRAGLDPSGLFGVVPLCDSVGVLS